jgi:hypothetical protein
MKTNKIDLENKKKQHVIDFARKVMQDELEAKGLNEAMLADLGLVDDFNDEIYLFYHVVNKELKEITLDKVFDLAHATMNQFINNYLRDSIMIGKLDRLLPEDAKKNIFILL